MRLKVNSSHLFVNVFAAGLLVTVGGGASALGSPINISNNDRHDEEPDINGDYISWTSDVFNENLNNGNGAFRLQIFRHQISTGTTTRITEGNTDDNRRVQNNGANLAWDSYRGGPKTLAYIDGSEYEYETEHDAHADIGAGDTVVWKGRLNGDDEIVLKDGPTGSMINISNRTGYDTNPGIDPNNGSSVVWRGNDGDGNSQIFYWDGSTVAQISDDTNDSVNPQIFGDKIVWTDDTGVALHDLIADSTRYIHLDGQSANADISGDWVVFQDSNGIESYQISTDTLAQVSPSGELPSIDGLNVVWQGNDGNDDEIYLDQVVPEPASALLLGLGGLLMGSRRRNRRIA